MRLDSLCTYVYALENLEVIDTPVHIHVHVVTMHEHKPIMMVLIASVRQIMVYPYKLCTKCRSSEIFP